MDQYQHTFKNNGNGNFTIAMDGANPKIHTFLVPTPTPSITPTVTPTRTPIPSVTPTPTPTITLTPSPSSQTSANWAVYGITNDGTGLSGTGDSAGFDGSGYTYSWNSVIGSTSNYYDGGSGLYWIIDSGSGQNFPIGPSGGQRGNIFTYPRFFRPWVSGLVDLKISCPYSNKRRVWILGAGIDGGGSVNSFYITRNKTNNTYSQGYYNTISMDDWCAGSTGQSVAVSTGRRNDSNGNAQNLTCRMYRYSLPQVATNEEIMTVGFYNSYNNSHKTRVVSVAFANS
jgi:hypothetical protein